MFVIGYGGKKTWPHRLVDAIGSSSSIYALLGSNSQNNLAALVRCSSKHLMRGLHLFQRKYGPDLRGKLVPINQLRDRLQPGGRDVHEEERGADI